MQVTDAKSSVIKGIISETHDLTMGSIPSDVHIFLYREQMLAVCWDCQVPGGEQVTASVLKA